MADQWDLPPMSQEQEEDVEEQEAEEEPYDGREFEPMEHPYLMVIASICKHESEPESELEPGCHRSNDVPMS